MARITKRKFFLILLVLIPLVYFLGYFIATAVGPYNQAKEFVYQNRILREKIGTITELKLAPFGYSVKMTGSHGLANYELRLKATNTNGKVFIGFEKDTGVWKITKAKLQVNNNSEEINLL